MNAVALSHPRSPLQFPHATSSNPLIASESCTAHLPTHPPALQYQISTQPALQASTSPHFPLLAVDPRWNMSTSLCRAVCSSKPFCLSQNRQPADWTSAVYGVVSMILMRLSSASGSGWKGPQKKQEMLVFRRLRSDGVGISADDRDFQGSATAKGYLRPWISRYRQWVCCWPTLTLQNHGLASHHWRRIAFDHYTPTGSRWDPRLPVLWYTSFLALESMPTHH